VNQTNSPTFLNTLTADGSALLESVKPEVKAEVDGAFGLVSKALNTLAGDTPSWPSQAEAAALQLVVNNVPPQYQDATQNWLTALVNGFSPILDETVKASVQKGLAYATGWLTSWQKAVDAHL
jgi:hypothetical protein